MGCASSKAEDDDKVRRPSEADKDKAAALIQMAVRSSIDEDPEKKKDAAALVIQREATGLVATDEDKETLALSFQENALAFLKEKQEAAEKAEETATQKV